MDKKHTKLPWRVSGDELEVYSKHPYGFDCASVVASCDNKSYPKSMNTGNTKFIVEACNNYDKLKSDKKRLLEALKGLFGDPVVDHIDHRVALENARQAIKEYGEEI